jgi:hypothetical protein
MASILKHSQEENVRDVHRLFYGVLGHGPRSCADAEIAAEVASLIQPEDFSGVSISLISGFSWISILLVNILLADVRISLVSVFL